MLLILIFSGVGGANIAYLLGAVGGIGDSDNDTSSYGRSSSAIVGGNSGDIKVAGFCLDDMGVLGGEGGNDVPCGSGTGGGGTCLFPRSDMRCIQ